MWFFLIIFLKKKEESNKLLIVFRFLLDKINNVYVFIDLFWEDFVLGFEVLVNFVKLVFFCFLFLKVELSEFIIRVFIFIWL